MDRLRICYDNHSLSESTRFLVNELFGKYGIVILDPNDKDLKKKLIPIIKEDVINQSLFPILSQNTSENAKLYKTQANVREINFFKLSESNRTRIDGNISELEIEQHPERFSPNVLIRPLYQEMILPNLAYIGGGAEISYWMQLKSIFKVQDIVFPVLVLRNSVMWIEEKDYVKWTELGFEIKDIFQSEENLYKQFVLKQSSFNLEEELIFLNFFFLKNLSRLSSFLLKSVKTLPLLGVNPTIRDGVFAKPPEVVSTCPLTVASTRFLVSSATRWVLRASTCASICGT